MRRSKKKMTWTNPTFHPAPAPLTGTTTTGRGDGVGGGVGGGGSRAQTSSAGSAEGVKIRGEYSRSRRGLSLLRRRSESGPRPGEKPGASARLAMIMRSASSVIETASRQRHAAAAGRVKLSLARARGVKGGNKWRRPGSSASSPAAPAPLSRRGGGSQPHHPRSSRPPPRSVSVVRLCGRFIRTGKCPRRFASGAARCTRRHDADKVAVCTRWLAGICRGGEGGGCPLTHRVIPERMPACSYFLAGACAAPACPYLHVNVDPTSPVCQSFLRGYCARGLQCRMRHTLVCPALTAGNTTCPNRAACRFHHPTAAVTAAAGSGSAKNQTQNINNRGVKRSRTTAAAAACDDDDGGGGQTCQPCTTDD